MPLRRKSLLFLLQAGPHLGTPHGKIARPAWHSLPSGLKPETPALPRWAASRLVHGPARSVSSECPALNGFGRAEKLAAVIQIERPPPTDLQVVCYENQKAGYTAPLGFGSAFLTVICRDFHISPLLASSGTLLELERAGASAPAGPWSPPPSSHRRHHFHRHAAGWVDVSPGVNSSALNSARDSATHHPVSHTGP